MSGILALQHGRNKVSDEVIGRNLIFAAPDRSTRNLPQAGDALVGVDFEKQKRRRGMSAERPSDGPLRMNRHLNGNCVDVSDLHEQVRLWRETRGLSIESGLWTSLVKPDCGVSENQFERYLHYAGVFGTENPSR